MFIKVADRQLSPSTLIMGRLGLAAVTLAAIVPFATGTRAPWPPYEETHDGSSRSRS